MVQKTDLTKLVVLQGRQIFKKLGFKQISGDLCQASPSLPEWGGG